MSPKFSIGDRVYYKGYVAEVLAFAGRTRFFGVRRYLINPYPDRLPLIIVKETKLLRAHV